MSTVQERERDTTLQSVRLRLFTLLRQPTTVRLAILIGIFLLAYFVPWSAPRVASAVNESLSVAYEVIEQIKLGRIDGLDGHELAR